MDLISKKELLSITGISYGQLYRWKRERLIPEEWFIKKSSFTGQETFLPREQAISRVMTILELKDKFSLEELGCLLSTGESVTISRVELLRFYGIGGDLLELLHITWHNGRCSAADIALTVGVVKIAEKHKIPQETLYGLITRCGEQFSHSKKSSDAALTLFKANGYHALFHKTAEHFTFDSGVEVLGTVAAGEIVSEIAGKLKDEEE